MAWGVLIAAILAEVSGTVSLRLAMQVKRWYAVVVAAYLTAFAMLALTLALGMPLGVAYGIWAAAGVALVALLDRLVFKEPLSVLMGVGIVLIVGGVLLIESGAAH